MKQRTFGQMTATIYDDANSLGRAAANDVARVLMQEIAARGQAAIVVATGNSQLSFMRAIGQLPGIDWAKVDVFHMDEYLGMSEAHPASFRRYIREKLVNVVKPRAFHGLQGDVADVDGELARYTALLRVHNPIACVLGIGENGHLAFNDPPADFDTQATVHIVALDDACRRQQVGEGHFPSFDAVPTHAISLTVPALLKPAHVFAVVPERRKAAAVNAALLGPVSTMCPASILRTQPHVRLYLDGDSASGLSRD